MRTSQPVLPGWLTYLLSVAFVFSGIAVVVFAYFTFQVMLNRPLNPLEESIAAVAGVDLSLEQIGPSDVPTLVPGQATPTLIPTSEPWEGTDRVNILLMGIDRRPGEAFISRTDTMMLMSLDPQTDSASILSIPRDLYVLIPGYGRDRINTAFVYGSAGNNPVGGAALAMQTVEYNLGVPVHHYVMVDFSAVINGINALGGIDLYVPTAINDPTYPDMNYGFDPLYIPAGQNHFDGATALKYARTRHQDNDFGRAARQQQVILAIKQRVAALGFTGMIAQAGTLYQQVENGVRTDLSLEQMIRLATAANGVDSEDIRNEVLNYDYVSSHRTQAGAQVLILENDKAAVLIQELFYNNDEE